MSIAGNSTILTECGAAELARLISAGDVSSAEVVEAHIARIEAVNPQINAVCVPLFDEARRAAARADAMRSRGDSLGPLHGVPVTVKECFHVAGTASTMGLTALRENVPAVDGPLVAGLRHAGAIILGKTNVPQLMILHETDNPLYGRTNNPWNLDRTPGGSSGGEAAVIAAAGSPLGLGSDLGGSIRIPAHFCGIHGFKPTTLRLTRAGVVENFRGFEAMQFQPGPMARKVEDLELAMRVFCGHPGGMRDYQIAPVPWPDAGGVDVSRLRIACWDDNGVVRPSPALRRVVGEAADALRAAGAEVEPFAPPEPARAMEYYFGLMGADGAADLRRLSRGSILDLRVAAIVRLGRAPRWLRRWMAWGLRRQGKGELAGIVAAAGPRSADGYWRLTYAAHGYVRDFLARLDEARFDAIVCPPHALAAVRHGEGGPEVLPAAADALLMNLLGVPCGVVAAGTVGTDEETDRPPSNSSLHRLCRLNEQQSAGLPVGVQVAARHWREDVVLAVMRVLEGHFGPGGRHVCG